MDSKKIFVLEENKDRYNAVAESLINRRHEVFGGYVANNALTALNGDIHIDIAILQAETQRMAGGLPGFTAPYMIQELRKRGVKEFYVVGEEKYKERTERLGGRHFPKGRSITSIADERITILAERDKSKL